MSETTTTTNSRPSVSGGGQRKSRFRNLKPLNIELKSDRNTNVTFAEVKEVQTDPSGKRVSVLTVPKAWGLYGKIYKIGFKNVEYLDKVTNEKKAFTTFVMTLINFDSGEAMYTESFERYDTTDTLLNKLNNVSKEDFNKYIQIRLGKRSQPVKDDQGNIVKQDGKVQYEDMQTQSGKNVSKVDVLIVGADDAEKKEDGTLKDKYTNMILWEKDDCTHPKLEKYKILRDTSRETKTGAAVSNFWRNNTLEKLEAMGWEKYETKPTNSSTENGYINKEVAAELEAYNTEKDGTAPSSESSPRSSVDSNVDNAQYEDAVVVNDTSVGSATTTAADDLPF